jgi:hypothetical protein
MRARPAYIDWRTYLDASLFPLKIFTVLALVWVMIWRMRVPDDDFCFSMSHMADFYYVAGWVGVAYIWCAILLMMGGIVQAFRCSQRAAIWSISFAVAASISGVVLLLNYYGPPTPFFDMLTEMMR